MKILLLQEDTEVRDKVGFALESSFAAEVDPAGRMNDGIHQLETAKKPYGLIVHDLQSAAPSEFQSLLMANASTPVLICVNGPAEKQLLLDPNIVGAVDRAMLVENLVSSIEKLIEAGKLAKPETEQNYCRIRTRLLLSVSPLKGDVYIRLSEWKYVKLFREGDVFDRGDMEKYTEKKGIHYLYLRKDQTGDFISKYGADLRKQLGQGVTTVDAAARNAATAHETIRELGRRVGFTREVQDLAKTQIAMTMQSVGKSPRLAEFLKRKIWDSKGEYISTHSTMVGYFACAIASQMEWGSELTFYKLNLAAFMHDITLHNQELAACDTMEEVKKFGSKFSEAEIKEYKAHPLKAAELSKTFSEIPPDVDVIISQHHEMPDASGFPRGLGSTYIAPLTVVFIMAHELARATLEKGPYFDMAEFVVGVKDKYKTSSFKKVLAAMERL